jgi:hypothetical protein
MGNLELLAVAVDIGIAITIMIVILVVGWIMVSIPIYFVTKDFDRNTSFEKVLGATILSAMIFPILTTILITILDFSPTISNNYYLYFTLLIWGTNLLMIISFIITLFIYKVAFNLDWGRTFVISIIATIIEFIFNSNLPMIFYIIAFLIPILGPVTMGIFTADTPVGTLAISINDIITCFMSGLILSTILIYLAAKYSKVNISFLETLVANMLSGTVSFIIIIISFLSYILEENIVTFYIGGVLASIFAFIIYKYILNVSWKKSMPMSIIVSVLWSIIGLKILPYYIHFIMCC